MPRLRKTSDEIANRNFAGELDKRKKILGYSDANVADIAGVSRACLYKWKKNPEMIPAGKLRLIVKQLKFPPDEVLAFLS